MLRKYLFLLAFPLGYAAAFLASSYYAVYHLDWWDVKFGGPAGNLEVGRELLPYFAMVATVSHLGGLAASWTRVRVATAWRIAVLEFMGGVLTDFLPFLYSVATRDLSPRHPWAGVDQGIALGLILLGPAVITWIVWWLASTGRQAARVAPAA